MNKKDRAKTVLAVLQKLYPHPKAPLQHKDPYTLLIAVLLSAQCTDKRVNLVTPALFAKASTPEEMKKLSIAEIQELIRTCGLSTAKARAIWHLSDQLISKHRSKVPKNLKELEELPGVGHKTASVVLTQAFSIPAFPVDTHIHRCAKRWGLSQGKNVKQTEKDLKRLFPRASWKKVHLQIIFYAREYCPAKGHKLDKCPLCMALS